MPRWRILPKKFHCKKFIVTVTDYIRVYRNSKQHKWFKEEYPNSKKIDKFIEENQQFSYDPINTDDEEYDLKYEVTIDSYFKLYKSTTIDQKKFFVTNILEYSQLLKIPESKLPMRLIYEVLNQNKQLITREDFLILLKSIGDSEYVTKCETFFIIGVSKFLSKLFNHENYLPLSIELLLLNDSTEEVISGSTIKEKIFFSEEALVLMEQANRVGLRVGGDSDNLKNKGIVLMIIRRFFTEKSDYLFETDENKEKIEDSKRLAPMISLLEMIL